MQPSLTSYEKRYLGRGKKTTINPDTYWLIGLLFSLCVLGSLLTSTFTARAESKEAYYEARYETLLDHCEDTFRENYDF